MTTVVKIAPHTFCIVDATVVGTDVEAIMMSPASCVQYDTWCDPPHKYTIVVGENAHADIYRGVMYLFDQLIGFRKEKNTQIEGDYPRGVFCAKKDGPIYTACYQNWKMKVVVVGKSYVVIYQNNDTEYTAILHD